MKKRIIKINGQLVFAFMTRSTQLPDECDALGREGTKQMISIEEGMSESLKRKAGAALSNTSTLALRRAAVLDSRTSLLWAMRSRTSNPPRPSPIVSSPLLVPNVWH